MNEVVRVLSHKGRLRTLSRQITIKELEKIETNLKLLIKEKETEKIYSQEMDRIKQLEHYSRLIQERGLDIEELIKLVDFYSKT